jgi:hypothetical protein
VGQHLGDPEGAGRRPEHGDAEQEPDIADPGDQERLHRGGRRLGQPPVVRDQQV